MENLDQHQTQQILLRISEDDRFHAGLSRNPKKPWQQTATICRNMLWK